MGIEITLLLVSLLLVSSQVYMLNFFLKKISALQKKYNNLQQVQTHMRLDSSKTPKKFSPKMIEGEIDLVFNGKKASLKAVFYPRKIV